MNNCFLEFKSSSVSDGQLVKIVSVAEYQYTALKQVIVFEEKDEKFVGGKTSITVEENKVTILRRGSYNTRIEAQMHKHNISQYGTPHGTCAIGIELKEFISTLNENGGRLKFSYVLDSDMNIIDELNFEIKIRMKSGI